MQLANVIFQKTNNAAVIRLNRPKEFNALNFELMGDFVKALEMCMDDREIRAVVVTGEGKAFCSGGDVAMFHRSENKGETIRQLTKLFHQVIVGIRHIPKPVIAAVNGVAAGGGMSVATACDLRIMASSAKFRQAYTASGLVPDGAWTLTVPLLIGFGRASELAFLDPVIDAERALAMGLVTQIAKDNELENAALDMAGKIAKGSATAFAVAKENLNRAMMGLLEQQLELERKGIIGAGKSADGQEGIASFMEKREPVFNKK